MLARVEGMPLESLLEGVPYDWRTFGDYLDKIDGKIAVNAGFLVGHSAIRRCVMGDDAVGKPASEDQIEAMQALLARIARLQAASASRRRGRGRTTTPRATPSRRGRRRRKSCSRSARRPSQHEGTTLEFIPSVGGFEEEHLQLMADMSPHREPAAQLERAGPELAGERSTRGKR